MEIKELRQKPETELRKLLAQLRENFRDMRFKIISKQHKDVREIRDVRKDIARVMTVLKEKHVMAAFSPRTPANKPEKK
jgi:large subunit ribosomal protein L29